MLDAMTPAFARAAGAAPTRLAFVYVPNGVTLDQWTPSAEAGRSSLGRILKPLESFRDRTWS